MQGTYFDSILKKALVKSVLAEYAELIADAENRKIAFSRRYLQQKRRMLRNPLGYVKNRIPTTYIKAIRIIAVAALIIMMSLAAGSELIPYKRNFKIEQFPAYIEVQILQDRDFTSSIQYGDYYPAFLPEGFVEKTTNISQNTHIIRYQFHKPGGMEIMYRVQGLMGGSVMCFDNEHGFFTEIKLNHRAALVKRASEEGWPNEVVWFSHDGTIMFHLSSKIELEELIKIARSIP